MKTITKAVIPVAGFGTRMLPITKSVPKEMLPLGTRPTLDYIIEEAYKSGITDILLITNPYKKCIEDYYDRNFEMETTLSEKNKTKELELITSINRPGLNIYFVRQGKPLGSGHAIKLAKNFVGDEAFAVLYGDDIMESKNDIPALRQLIDIYEITNGNVIGVQEVALENVSRYGMIEFINEKTDQIRRIVEKPKVEETPSTWAGLGRYIINNEVFNILDTLQRGAGNEYQFTDAMGKMMELNHKFYACKLNATYYDTGSQIGYFKAFDHFAKKSCAEYNTYLKEK